MQRIQPPLILRTGLPDTYYLIAVFIELLDQGAGCGGFAFELRLVGLVGKEDIADVDCIADILLPLADDAGLDRDAFLRHDDGLCARTGRYTYTLPY